MAFILEDLGGGGVQRFSANLSLELCRNGCDNFFFLGKDERTYEFSGRIRTIGFADAPECNFFQKAFRFIRRILQIRQAKKRDKVEFAISALDESNVANILSRVSERVILTVHNNRSHPLFNNGVIHKFFLHRLIRLMYRHADLCVAVSKGLAWDYSKHFGVPKSKVRVIYNMQDGGSIRTHAKEPLRGDVEAVFKDPVILTAGRFCKQKGQWHLIRIFASLKKLVPEARLMLLGEGEYKDELIFLAESLGLRVYGPSCAEGLEGKDVFFMGFQQNPYAFYARASVFVFPSLFEGFGCVLTEAMACGLPVISADCRFGPREILAPDTDFLYETGMPEYAPYGVLMPVLDGSFRGAQVPLTPRETLWEETIVRLLRDLRLRQEYFRKGPVRSMDFEVSKITPIWMECLAQLQQGRS